ncbi:hypothetical protein QFC22_004297 [Naganishia vaughanmartiniae]|uniref:Uncharacterized protein n=1 Tax=Naganishia vaughanmartiniae TaxID=1424756 RepID=A0ACC2X2D1_9TREE|nr:hypothetical protein QFC22_004297 [Naganishia vaughanmartiniae]
MMQHDIFNIAHPFRPAQQDDARASPGVSPKILSSSAAAADSRGWEGKGPSRTVNSVFPGVDSWPTTPIMGAPATPPTIASASVTPPQTLTRAMTLQPTPTASMIAHHTPSPHDPMQPTYTPAPAHGQYAYHDEDEDDKKPWYSWLCCLRRKARRRVGRIA